jgi:guanosine-3',5'-bis(diphosphate) 3'-pyrophosphohydrolase
MNWLNMIEKAKNYAQEAHKGQVRKLSGEPYYNHVHRVYSLASRFTDNPDILTAALLHDTVEDCDIKVEEIEYEFNLVVGSLVEELTNVYTKKAYSDIDRKSRKKKEHERLGKISWSGRLLKLADRVDNLLSYKKEHPDYGPDFYYLRETRDLLQVLKGTHPALESILERELGV